MHYSVAPNDGLASHLAIGQPAGAGGHVRSSDPAEQAQAGFEAMCIAYRSTGGIGRIGEFVDLFARQQGPTAFTLASWIERRQVISFEWDGDIWLPWFQFHRVALVPHPQLAVVFAELMPIFDTWELACWFAHPNSWLAGRTPVDTLLSDLDAVREAARADRFIVDG